VTLRDRGLIGSGTTCDAGAPIAALAFAGSVEFVVTGGPTIDLRETATGRVLFRREPPKPPAKALELDGGSGGANSSQLATHFN
jgi:hypothetical protein